MLILLNHDDSLPGPLFSENPCVAIQTSNQEAEGKQNARSTNFAQVNGNKGHADDEFDDCVPSALTHIKRLCEL